MSDPRSVEQRFLEKVDKSGTCWLWKGGGDRYGVFSIGDGVIGAHVAAYKLFVGDVPEGLWVLHTCDNGMCVNPAHLYAGTPQQNQSDRNTRGRANLPCGERHWQGLLTRSIVLAIRAEPHTSSSVLAARFDISRQTVNDVRTFRTWKHVKAA